MYSVHEAVLGYLPIKERRLGQAFTAILASSKAIFAMILHVLTPQELQPVVSKGLAQSFTVAEFTAFLASPGGNLLSFLTG